VCHLYIARSYALEGNELGAKEAFQKWDKGGTIEHTWVHHLSDSVKADIDNLGRSFFIKASEDLNYKQRLSELREWLLEQAKLKEPSNLSKRAKLLGITRARLSQLVNRKTSQHSQDMR
jgi:predicted XRE-type DNA-binding protein